MRQPYKTARCILYREHKFLLAVHSGFWGVRNPRWGLPGGQIEFGESPETAVARELEEELNISQDQVDFIGSLGHFQTITRPRDIEAFIGLWNGKGAVRFDVTEIARILEIPLKTLVGIHQARHYHNRQMNTHELEYPFGDVVIWGATAKILYRFIELIYPLVH